MNEEKDTDVDTPEFTDAPEFTDVPEFTDTSEFTDAPEFMDTPEFTDVPEFMDKSQIVDAEVLENDNLGAAESETAEQETDDLGAAESGAAEQETTDQAPAGRRKKKSGGIHNIFDSVFRTIARYLPQLIIPLINEAFQTAYPPDAEIEVKPNDHFTWGGVYVTDLTIMLGGRLYHVECQSNPDGRMIIRIMEYASFIALDNAKENDDGIYTVDFPESCVIYLRSTRNTPDKLTVHIRFPKGQSVVFDVPLIKMADYSMDQLFEKKLLMLLPYYLMRYEKDCKEAGKLDNEEDADWKMKTFMEECERLLKKLSDSCTEKEQQYMFQTLADLIIEVAMYLAPENKKEKVKSMGGTVIRTRAQVLREEGEAIGEERGKLETLAELVRDKILTIDQAASRRSLTVDDFKKQCVKYNLTL